MLYDKDIREPLFVMVTPEAVYGVEIKSGERSFELRNWSGYD